MGRIGGLRHEKPNKQPINILVQTTHIPDNPSLLAFSPGPGSTLHARNRGRRQDLVGMGTNLFRINSLCLARVDLWEVACRCRDMERPGG